MTDEELKAKLAKLEQEVEDLKKQLKENSQKDKKHHKELKQIQQQQHKENLAWNKTGTLLTPLVVVLAPIILKYLEKKNKSNEKD